MMGIRTKLFPDLANMDIDSAVDDIHIMSPHFVEYGFATDNAIRVTGKKDKYFKLLLGEMKLFALYAYEVITQLDLNLANLENV